MYNVVIPDRASKDLEKIDKKTQKIILLKIKEYSSNPFRYSTKLSDTGLEIIDLELVNTELFLI